ncbi:MAG: tetratricopeptide repeat protein [Pseudomonadaceae bacterium]|nr:tetratricopeptide repeat protein [Pseudomonadaceae bacterium]
MTRLWVCVALGSLVLSGCASVPRGAIPVVDASGRLIDDEQGSYAAPSAQQQGAAQAQSLPQDSGVVVMVPGGAASTPLETYPDGSSGAPLSYEPAPMSSAPQPAFDSAPSMPSGIPQGGGLAADEQLDGPVLALLTTAQQQQGGGDLNGAASSLERAQRIAPREPQVLYRLAEVRLAQGDAAQAEQLARRGLTYAGGRPALQAGLWSLIGQARERQGDPAGAAQARERARVSL